VRARWFSRRAIKLHAAVLTWVAVCLFCFWWQVTRAMDGNALSYLYSVEWPVFALVGLVMWWVLLHTDPDTVGARGLRRKAAEAEAAAAGDGVTAPPGRNAEDEDEALAAYNDRLAALAAKGPKTWRNR
jgi:hypothetical protein